MEIINYRKKNFKSIYLGVEVLRMILSFLIVVVHCYNKKYIKIKLLYFPFFCLCFYVPTFFLISFYFSYKTFISRNIVKIKERFLRLLIPYIIWPVIFWLRFQFMNYLDGRNDKDKFKNLYYQIIIGDGFHGVFWFQFNLILFSILLTIIILLFKKKCIYVILTIGLLMLIFNFGGFLKIFTNYNHSVNHSIRPIPLTFIYSITGFFLGKFFLVDKLYRHKLITLFFLLPFIYVIKIYPKLFIIFKNFKIIIIIYIIINLFLFFAIIPFDIIKNNIILIIVKKTTSFTAGVYYLHPEIRNILKKYIIIIKNKTFIGCVLNYFICYSICLIGSKIFRYKKLKYLFI